MNSFFKGMAENTWVNSTREEKWVKWERTNEGLKLSLVELWSDNNISMNVAVIPDDADEIKLLTRQHSKSMDGYLNDELLWSDGSGLTETPIHSEHTFIEKICIEFGETVKEKSYKSDAGIRRVLRSFGVTTIRPFLSEEEIDIELMRWVS